MTGKSLSGLAHVRQSIRDILTTPIGSRAMLREYGSRISELLDRPLNDETRLDIIAATAEALDLWEPRIAVTQVDVYPSESGDVAIGVTFTYLGEVFVEQGVTA